MTDLRWKELCDRWGAHGYSALAPAERTWLNIRSLIDAIENGGAISYFYNSGADTLADCRLDLQRLDAHDVLAQLDRVCGLFGGSVPSDMDARNEVIDSWGDDDSAKDELLEDIDDRLMPMMAGLESKLHAHLQRHGLAT